MKKLVEAFVVVLMAFIFNACAEENPDTGESHIIEFGSACGWCAGTEYIEVTNEKILYTRTIPCGENEGIYTGSDDLSEAEWLELQNTFDYDEFLTLEYNECNVCVDGCDEILKITHEDETHELRYDPELDIAEISGLQTKLRKLMQEFNAEN